MRYPGISLKLIEGVPAQLATKLEKGEIDVALMAMADGFPERFDIKPIYKRALPDCLSPRPSLCRNGDAVPIAAVNGENYLRRTNCEYRDALAQLIKELRQRHPCLLPERTRGLDPEHGGRRPWHLLHPGIQRGHSGPGVPAGDRTRSLARHLPGHRGRPPHVAGARDLSQGGERISLARKPVRQCRARPAYSEGQRSLVGS